MKESNKVVWLLNHYAQEPGSSGGTRHYGLAKHMETMGWDMKIIAASVDHFTGDQRITNRESHATNIIDGVSFTWLKTPKYEGSGVFRILNILCYSFRAYFGRWKKNISPPDVIIGSSVHPFAAIAAAFLAKKHSVPFIFEVRDLWPETLIAMGRWSEHSIKTKIFRIIEKWLYMNADKIITLLPYANEYIESLGVPRNKISWISNGAEISSPPSSLNQKDTFTLMYFGSHGPANSLDTILEAMSILQVDKSMSHVSLRLIGDGASKASLIQTSIHLNLTNVFFEKSVTKEEIPKLAEEADAFVIPIGNRPELYRYGISPNKIFDYLSAARPIVIASNAANNPIEDANAGLTTEPDNPEKLAQSIKKLVNTPFEIRVQMGSNGRKHVEDNYSYEKLAQKMVSTLDSIN
ncbi:glycosyltransferase family 4 protein [Cocleimonas sp. KMM 6892]|uniref:glycosyltransferase family 4 protein n=1 Tax=unclassified Cocleimonas TaxID=2639732 RepID=UPI002DBFF6F9|nr:MULTISPECIES: glycosyltransferase family 4 protein [unclassified Cocleimonas]MEB8430944.1 glycosyltransferase family 4 protein [Cocleimonas sp. KMM 6892]MEC4714284.1 glycosyltransferase family 4 protein [Cocleimonas sp. KMM 6895]MEC4743615.1 glycosyltransferase family 4 protein [Cocleimonas sp. KMM 6896]